MWEVEPTLYWRVKRDGEWRYERTRFVQVQPGLFALEFPKPPQMNLIESDVESDGDDRSDTV